MKFNHIYFIVNPAAGTQEPVEELISEIFQGDQDRVSVHVMQEGEQASDLVRKAMRGADLVAVYGGDGSVTEGAAGLIGSKVPLAIIPGGTANVLAKELGVQQDTREVLEMLRDGRCLLKTMDTALVNDRPFLLRINMGIMAEMITGTDPELKDKIGQLAYGVATVQSIRNAELVDYQLVMDGKPLKVSGVSLTVTNSGHMGVGELQLQPGISINDGLLDVVLLKDAGWLSVIKAAGSSLLGQETDAVWHWKCREITISMKNKQTYLCDDCQEQSQSLNIKVVPASLKVVVPVKG